MALHAPLDELGAIPPAAQFCLPVAVAIRFKRILRYISGPFQDRTDSSSGLTLLHYFCIAAQIKMPLRVSKRLVAELAARKLLSFFNEPTIASFFFLDQSLMQSSRLTSIVGEDLERRCH